MATLVFDPDHAREIIAAHAGQEGAALPILHALQEAFGYVDPEALPLVADALNLSRAELHGIVTFYADFRTAPAGRHVVKLCRAEACQAVGAVELARHLRDRLGIDWHGTSRDGRITLEPAFCLGLCSRGPAALVDGEPIAALDPARLDAALAGLGRPAP